MHIHYKLRRRLIGLLASDKVSSFSSQLSDLLRPLGEEDDLRFLASRDLDFDLFLASRDLDFDLFLASRDLEDDLFLVSRDLEVDLLLASRDLDLFRSLGDEDDLLRRFFASGEVDLFLATRDLEVDLFLVPRDLDLGLPLREADLLRLLPGDDDDLRRRPESLLRSLDADFRRSPDFDRRRSLDLDLRPFGRSGDLERRRLLAGDGEGDLLLRFAGSFSSSSDELPPDRFVLPLLLVFLSDDFLAPSSL